MSDDVLGVEVFRELCPDRENRERQLVEGGVPIPLTSRVVWARCSPPEGAWFLAVHDRCDHTIGGLALDVHKSRAMPGHLLLRCQRLGSNLPAAASLSALNGLARLARQSRRVLRVNVEVLSPAAEVRDRLASDLSQAGFHRLSEMRGYAATLSVDLTASEESMLASFNQSTRRKIRGIGKFPVAVRPIDDPSLASHMEKLVRETRSRTGGSDPPRDWKVPIALSQAEPSLSRLVGLFHEESKGPASLLAFAWGCGHGDHAHYHSGASTRAGASGIPCAHALLWDLMCWAKRTGCRWFDLGGITAGRHGSDDRLGGISDFKRGFSKQLVEVGQEWVFEPSATRAALAQGLAAASQILRIFSRLRRD
jgi:hypothetical protein